MWTRKQTNVIEGKMSNRYDAIIIGAGVIGSCTAFELAKKGLKTLSIDKNPESGYGSTSNSSAIIRTYYSAYETCAIAFEGLQYWRNWGNYVGDHDELGLIRYHETGCLVIKTPTNNNLSNICEMMHRIGCLYEDVPTEKISDILPIADTRQYYPAKRMEDDGFAEPTGPAINGAVYFPEGGYVNDPKLAAHNAQRAAEAAGAKFMFKAEVVEILKTDGRVAGVKLADGREIGAPVVINIAGPHSSKVNEMAGVADSMNIKTRALRQEVCYVPSPKDFNFEEKGMIYSDSDIQAYCRPEIGGKISIGSEDPECDGHEWVDDPDNFNEEFTDQWTVQVMRMAQRLQGLPIPNTASGVVALYDVSDDWMPIYDKSDLPGFYMGVGTSGNQFKNAPVAGQIMAALVTQCEAGYDHDNDPIQFKLENIDREISLGAFSRNREINKNSSFSVIG
jgi:glycine/D-amino acid oxidase-like deaminating enzyme